MPGLGGSRATGVVEGDLVETFEFSPDRLQLILKLRQGLRWDQKAPTGGRLIDAQDVVFSWNKFARGGFARSDLAYNATAAPGAPIESISSPDPRTVIFKLKQVDASLLALLAYDRGLYIMPRESEASFDPRLETRGYGPWLMTESRTGVQRLWARAPEYYVKGRPFIDKIEQPIIHGYSARLTQFRAGLIWTNVASQDDVIPLWKDVPGLILRQADNFATTTTSLGFGYQEASPWRDQRVRQAVSLLINRQALVDMRSNKAVFEAEGLPLDIRYHTAVSAGWQGYWIDPREEAAFGPNARFFRFLPDEAKKLLTAAGYPEGLDTPLHYTGGGEYGPGYTRTAELTAAMLYEGGIRATPDPRDFQSDWQPNYNSVHAAAGGGRLNRSFPGLILRFGSPNATFAAQAYAAYHPAGSRFVGATADGKNPHLGDPEMNKQLEDIRKEFDLRRQQSLAWDFARSMAAKTYEIPIPPHSSLPYSLTWPALSNVGTSRVWPGGNPVTESAINLWIDGSKAPLKS